MLQQIDLERFKCFELLRLPLKPLTLLTGTNASGKSSVLQALVLLHQTMREHEWSTRLMLNGSLIQLGRVIDVVDKVNGTRGFAIGLIDNEQEYRWQFTGERADMSLQISSLQCFGRTLDSPEDLRFMLPADDLDVVRAHSFPARMQRLTYITAERVGPREFYPLADRQASPVVGPAGEHAASVLQWGRDEPVLEGLRILNTPPTRIRQVEARMMSFFPGCAMELQQVAHTNAVTFGIRTSDDTDFHRPIHVGFGLTQVFPILVAILSASKGDIVLIENPEVHLHPAGQAQMGQFLAEAASAGVQVILETHSDHVLNGVRRSVKERRIASEDVAIHFFRKRQSDCAQVISPQINSNGSIDEWPDGFFDQFDKDASYFAGWGE